MLDTVGGGGDGLLVGAEVGGVLVTLGLVEEEGWEGLVEVQFQALEEDLGGGGGMRIGVGGNNANTLHEDPLSLG